MTDTIRLDLFLWYARFAKTRPVAQAMVATGTLRLDGRRVERAHVPVRVGSILTFAKAGQVRVIRVDTLPQRRGPAAEAQTCYTQVDPVAAKGVDASGAAA